MTISDVPAGAALRAGTALTALAFAVLMATPAYAQDQGATTQSTDPAKQDQATSNAPHAGTNAAATPLQNANPGSTNEEIVITGTIFRRTNTETPSPVTVVSSESMARRGLTNISDAVRAVSADSSGSIPNAFAAGFGAGASAPSLRGLTVNSTLTLVDGQRITNYPLSDDGQRSFVDLNTMPRVSIERVEVLKDGASSTYGADAIGGVVNVIQRKTFNGLDATLEGGTSEHGGGDEYRGSVLAGWGDYDERGINFYVGAEYELNKKIYARDRGFPFNTNDLTRLDGGLNLNADLTNSGITPTVAEVRPATQLNNNDLLNAIPGQGFQLLNPAQCAAIGGSLTSDPDIGASCEENQVANYGEIQPKTERYGIVTHGAVRLSEDIEAYMNLSWYRNNLTAGGLPQALRTTSPIQTTTFVLPNWVCAAGVNCDTAADRTLNPYNPFASAVGDPLTHAAQLYYRFGEADGFNRNAGFRNEVLRGAVGVSGTFGDGFHFNVDGTASQSRLRLTADVISLAGFTQAIATGQYNLIDPTLNSQAVRDSVILHNDYTATSALYAIQGVVTKELFQLPGGPLQLGVGGHFRHESLDNPDGNPTADFIAFNQANAKGERDVEAGFFEISAPIVKQLEVQLSGRYDHYSTGFSNFSPKAGFKFTPIRQLALRGTWSKGFRAPSFAETSGQITGFTTYTPGGFQSLCESHGGTFDGTSCTGGSPYTRSGQALGFRNNANPDLKPEKSESYTAGLILQPIRQLSLTVDYYHIKKKDIITGGPLSNSALSAYYDGTALPAGYSVILNPIDPSFPGGVRSVAIIVGPYANASSLVTSGFDFAAQADFRLTPGLHWSSNVEATRINKYNFRSCEDDSDPACGVQKYVGTQGPYILSSGAGTPRWRGNWSNSFEFGRATLTATANYVSGYKNVAEDQSGPGVRNCGDLYNDDTLCHTKSFTWVDLVGSYKLTDAITVYGNVLNLFDAKAPVNPPNYAAANYNPTYTQMGAVGRFFRAGVNISFRPKEHVVPLEPVVAPPPPPPATQTCPDGSVIEATATCPAPPPPPPPPAAAPERG
jgi:iron complex outermembrane recepter protein